MSSMLQRLRRGLGDVVFPPVCVHCRGLVPDDGEFAHLCPRCVKEVDFVQPPHCSTCGHPFYGEVVGEQMCPHCTDLVPAYREGRTAVLSKGPGRTLVHELKYHHGLYVLTDIEAVFRRAAHVLDLVRDAVLVPVPLHPRKERERGYNQSELIATALARAAGGSVRVELLLKRTADTVSQTHYDKKTRRLNLKNAFALAPGAALNPELHYVLVDDVFTTGSTLNSCALALRRSGALNLDVITFGHG